MKKYLFIALAATALASCSSDEVVELNEGNEIKFSVVADNDSRAATVYCNNNLMTDFTLYATTGSVSFINGETYTLEAGKYSTNAKRYWPESAALDFYAIKNATGSWNAAETNPLTGNFAVERQISKQLDFVYAVKPDMTKNSEGVTDGTVKLNFRHALSQIEFKAKNGNSDLKIVIKDVKVGNVSSKADFALPTATTDANIINHNQGSAATLTSQELWSNLTETECYTFNYTATDASVVTEFTDVVIGADGTDLTISGTDEANASFNTIYAKSMLLIPQKTTAWNGTTGSYLAVKCCIYNVCGSDEVLLYGDKDGDGTAEGRWAYVPLAFDWKAGYKYIYTFNFANGGNAGYDDGGKDDTDEDTPGNDPVLVNLAVDVTVDDFEPATEETPEMKTE